MKDSEKERIKLLATFFNNTAIACATLGFLSPLIAAVYGLGTAPPIWKALVFGAGWVIFAFALHVLASFQLGELDK